jgi:hypothetical protein
METYEEWRLIFDVGKWKALAALDELADNPLEQVDVHRRGDQLLVYARSEEAIRAAQRLVSRVLEERGATTLATLTRWNPGAERWQDPSLPVEPPKQAIGPEWAALGELAWEVRIRSQEGREARRLAQDLTDAGLPTITGLGNRITVGAEDEREASTLANDLRLRAPTARIETRPLSRWRRWLIRQRLLGNYGSGGDLGSDSGGNGGGGGG